MLVSTLVIAAFGASTTFATPLLGSLGGSRVDIGHQDDSVPHLHGRDVNKAGKTELPTVAVALSLPGMLADQMDSVTVIISFDSSLVQTMLWLPMPSAASTLPPRALSEPPSHLPILPP